MGFSQMELVERTDIAWKTVSRIEGGDSGIRKNTIKNVHEALGLQEEGAPGTTRHAVYR